MLRSLHRVALQAVRLTGLCDRSRVGCLHCRHRSCREVERLFSCCWQVSQVAALGALCVQTAALFHAATMMVLASAAAQPSCRLAVLQLLRQLSKVVASGRWCVQQQ